MPQGLDGAPHGLDGALCSQQEMPTILNSEQNFVSVLLLPYDRCDHIWMRAGRA